MLEEFEAQPLSPRELLLKMLEEGTPLPTALESLNVPIHQLVAWFVSASREMDRLQQWVTILHLSTKNNDLTFERSIMGHKTLSPLMKDVMLGIPAPDLGIDIDRLNMYLDDIPEGPPDSVSIQVEYDEELENPATPETEEEYDDSEDDVFDLTNLVIPPEPSPL